MRVNTSIQYGVRAIFDMAFYGRGNPSSILEIAKRQRISPNYLEQIFQKLKKAGLVKSRKGPGGGFILTKSADEITLGEIIRAVEGPIQLVFCVGEESRKKRCILTDRCVTTFVWRELGEKIAEFFDSITIGQLCRKGDELGIKRNTANINLTGAIDLATGY
jgi:Rrf2 family protein